jgi:hypothetical protein
MFQFWRSAIILAILTFNCIFSRADVLEIEDGNVSEGISPNPEFQAGERVGPLYGSPFYAPSVDLTCGEGRPCEDKSCCNGNSCGLRPEYCDKPQCISNCGAKAECGVGASEPGKTCPLNVSLLYSISHGSIHHSFVSVHNC